MTDMLAIAITILMVMTAARSYANIANKLTPAPAQSGSFTIVLDAGHGGKDPGAIGSTKGSNEKTINLAIVKEIGRLLSVNAPDIKVVYTRSTDTFVELGRRAEIANKAKADLFVSVHVNSLPKGRGSSISGVQSYTLALKTASTNLDVEKNENAVIEIYENGQTKYNYNSRSSENDIMYELMQDEHMKLGVDFAKLTQREMVSNGKRRDMGVQQANLAVLRLTYMPSVLLEVGYISNASEETYLNSANGQANLARCIYNAIVSYRKKTTGKTAPNVPVQTTSHTPEQTPQESSANSSTAAGSSAPTGNQPAASSSPSASSAGRPVFKVQILAGAVELKPNDRQFKGLKTEKYKDGARYRYYHGSTTDYNEIVRIRKSILAQFPEAFIVAFKDGAPTNVNEAIAQWRKSK